MGPRTYSALYLLLLAGCGGSGGGGDAPASPPSAAVAQTPAPVEPTTPPIEEPEPDPEPPIPEPEPEPEPEEPAPEQPPVLPPPPAPPQEPEPEPEEPATEPPIEEPTEEPEPPVEEPPEEEPQPTGYYTLHEVPLGEFPVEYVHVGGINNLGHVAGVWTEVEYDEFGNEHETLHPFVYRSGEVQDIEIGVTVRSIRGINDYGDIIGHARDVCCDDYGFIYWNGKVEVVPGEFSTVTDINNFYVVGAFGSGDIDLHGFVWDGNSYRLIGTLGGDWSIPESVNDLGQAVGSSGLEESGVRAFFWDGMTMTNLGEFARWSLGRGVNNRGHATGESGLPDCCSRAFVWQGGELQTIADPEYAYNTRGHYITDEGTIVGIGVPTEENPITSDFPFVVEEGGEARTLHDLVSPNEPLRGSVIWRDMGGINDSGQILVSGWVRLNEFMGYSSLFILTPEVQ